MDPKLFEILVCPLCKGPLVYLTDAGVDWKGYVRLVGARPSAMKVSADRKADLEADLEGSVKG